jgi:hypothetical protein
MNVLAISIQPLLLPTEFEQLVCSRGVVSCTVDCVVMYQYYLHSDRFERSSILGVCMCKGHWRPDMSELRGPSGSDPFTSKLGCGLPFLGEDPVAEGIGVRFVIARRLVP